MKCDGVIVAASPLAGNKQSTEVGTGRFYPVAVFDGSALYMTSAKGTDFANPPARLYLSSEADSKKWLESDDVKTAKLVMQSLSK